MPLIFYPKRDEMWSGPWIPSISHNFQGDLWHGRRLAQRILINMTNLGFPVGLQSKKSACNAGDMGLIPGWGRSPGEGNDYPLEYCCLDNSMDSPMDCSLPRLPCPWGHKESDVTEQLTHTGFNSPTPHPLSSFNSPFNNCSSRVNLNHCISLITCPQIFLLQWKKNRTEQKNPIHHHHWPRRELSCSLLTPFPMDSILPMGFHGPVCQSNRKVT